MSTAATPATAAAAPPAAAPSTPAPATPSTSTPAPPSTPAAAPASPPAAAPPAGPPKMEDFPDNVPAYVEAYGAWKHEQKPAEEVPVAGEAAPATTGEDANKPPEEVAPAGEDTPPAAEAAPATEEDLTKPPAGLELDGSMSALELNEKLKANPELDKLLKADPSLKGSLFRNARLAEKAAPYEELFGADGIEGAKAAVQNASTWVEVDRRFLNATTPQAAHDVLNFWAEQATYVDDKGNKIQKVDANGRPVFHNGQPVYEMAKSFTYLLQHIRDTQLDMMLAGAKAKNDLELQDALEVIKARTAGAASPSVNEEEVPEHLKQREARLREREQEQDRRERERNQGERQQFEASVESDIDLSIDALVSPVLEKANLSPFLVKVANDEIGNQIVTSLENNRFFQSRLAELYALPPSADTQKRIKHLVVSQVQGVAGSIVRKVVAEASQGFVTKAGETREKVRNQEATTRQTEPRSSAGPASPSVQKQTPEQLYAEAEKQFEQQKGYKPTSSDTAGVLEIYGRLNRAQKGARAS